MQATYFSCAELDSYKSLIQTYVNCEFVPVNQIIEVMPDMFLALDPISFLFCLQQYPNVRTVLFPKKDQVSFLEALRQEIKNTEELKVIKQQEKVAKTKLPQNTITTLRQIGKEKVLALFQDLNSSFEITLGNGEIIEVGSNNNPKSIVYLSVRELILLVFSAELLDVKHVKITRSETPP